MIEVKQLRKAYGQHEVLKDVSLNVPKGTVFALLGENGAGKTTMINILTTLLRPDHGTVVINGYDITKHGAHIRKDISLTGQYAAVDELLTGRENMLMMARFYHMNRAQSIRRTDELLAQFELVDAAKRRVATYSGGMRRRLDLAISLLASPSLVFLDEPTTGLDPRSRRTMWKLIKEMVAGGMTVFLTTQYLEEADYLADTIAVIANGVIAAKGTPAQLKQKIGGAKLRFTFQNIALAVKARELIDGSRTLEDDAKTIEVTTTGSPEELRSMLNVLAQQHLNPSQALVHAPTLDDVFFKLTGHKQKEDN